MQFQLAIIPFNAFLHLVSMNEQRATLPMIRRHLWAEGILLNDVFPLRHEVNDYCISQAIKPYREVTNRLITMLNEDAFRTKAPIVEALTRLVS